MFFFLSFPCFASSLFVLSFLAFPCVSTYFFSFFAFIYFRSSILSCFFVFFFLSSFFFPICVHLTFLKKYGNYAAIFLTRARRANAEYNVPAAISAHVSCYAVLLDSSARPRRTRSPVQTMLNLDNFFNQAVVDKLDSTHFSTLPKLTVQCLLTVPFLLQAADFLEDVSSNTQVRAALSAMAHNLLWDVAIGPGVVAKACTCSN